MARNLLFTILIVSSAFLSNAGTVSTLTFSEADGSTSLIVSKNELVEKIYPNPVTQNLNVKFNYDLNEQVDILILDVIGSVVKKESLSFAPAAEASSIDLTELNNGVYFIQVQTKSNKESYRFIIRR